MSASPSSRPPRRRLGVEQRREQLIAVALEFFAKQAPEEVSIDEIAAAAGASRPLVYHYFPGKQGLYEEAIRRAGEQLAGLFEEPREGPLSERLYRVMGRYLGFVESHGPGFAALLRGGSASASPGTGAVIDRVRQAALEQVVSHLDLAVPSARVRLTVRSWIANAETTALAWLADLDESQPQPARLPREELQLRLVQEFVAMLLVSLANEPELLPAFRGFFAQERPQGPTGLLVQRLGALLADPGLAAEALRLAAPDTDPDAAAATAAPDAPTADPGAPTADGPAAG
ncbi:TetR/AcrR family transcriptional regulator [Streptacidiphilus sp. PB12-B1b]|uniref:TetR/AcrR family transcriptional regulator n=1 Tax=Streptacidiphilus sp. PB12-B1b TaxID=2705012 RepID=UPI0015FA02DD|nr:TetR/AcrR family transcriptional regulator [Streptacidiphilus sp. PB12-B1b]QMU79719.1 TetR/AcrR family transcriptional regulator [Streptacidiphilus sp. PB12-B1b]